MINYTIEQNNFFLEYTKGHSPAEVIDEFENRFGIRLNYAQVRHKMTRAGGNGINTRFCKDHEINKGRPGRKYPMKKEHNIKWQENGSEILRKGEWYVKIDGKWYRKNRVIWEKEYGPIPEGKFLFYRDGNKENCTLENLIMVDNAVSIDMTRKDSHGTRDDLHAACIAQSVLECAIRGIDNEKRNCKENGKSNS